MKYNVKFFLRGGCINSHSHLQCMSDLCQCHRIYDIDEGRYLRVALVFFYYKWDGVLFHMCKRYLYFLSCEQFNFFLPIFLYCCFILFIFHCSIFCKHQQKNYTVIQRHDLHIFFLGVLIIIWVWFWLFFPWRFFPLLYYS